MLRRWRREQSYDPVISTVPYDCSESAAGGPVVEGTAAALGGVQRTGRGGQGVVKATGDGVAQHSGTGMVAEGGGGEASNPSPASREAGSALSGTVKGGACDDAGSSCEDGTQVWEGDKVEYEGIVLGQEVLAAAAGIASGQHAMGGGRVAGAVGAWGRCVNAFTL